MYVPSTFRLPSDLMNLLDTENDMDEMDEIYDDIIERVSAGTISQTHLKDLPPYLRRSLSGSPISFDEEEVEDERRGRSVDEDEGEYHKEEEEHDGEEMQFAIDIDSEEEQELQAHMFASHSPFYSLPTRSSTPSPYLDRELASPSPLYSHENPTYTSLLSSFSARTDLSNSPPPSPTESETTEPYSPLLEERIWTGPEHGYCKCMYSSLPASSGSEACANYHHPWAQEERSRIQGRGRRNKVIWWRERKREVEMVYGGSKLREVRFVDEGFEEEGRSKTSSSMYSPMEYEHEHAGRDDVMMYDAEDEGEGEEDDPLPDHALF